MKKLFTLLLAMLPLIVAQAQTTPDTTRPAASGAATQQVIPEDKLKPTGPIFEGDQSLKGKNFKFGLGVGPSTNLNRTYSYTLRAPDYALTRQLESRNSFVLSGVVAYNKTVYYRHLDKDGEPVGEPYARPYPLSALLSLNFAEFTGAGSSFNRRIDGGLGLGARIDENFHVGLFLEASSRRFLYDAYEQYIDKPLPSFVANQALTVLAQDNDTYFVSKPVFSLTLKVVYIFSDELPKAKTPADVAAAASKK